MKTFFAWILAGLSFLALEIFSSLVVGGIEIVYTLLKNHVWIFVVLLVLFIKVIYHLFILSMKPSVYLGTFSIMLNDDNPNARFTFFYVVHLILCLCVIVLSIVAKRSLVWDYLRLVTWIILSTFFYIGSKNFS